MAPATKLPEPAIPGDADESQLVDTIVSLLDQESAEDILTIDLAGKSAEADHMVIASGRSSRHVAALSEKLIDKLKDRTGRRARAEGRDSADWVLIDAEDVIVHIFRPEVRDFYQLEKMWLTAPDQTARRA
ncbi:MAG: ribosome silencing factor [Pseudomonadota bacterium]